MVEEILQLASLAKPDSGLEPETVKLVNAVIREKLEALRKASGIPSHNPEEVQNIMREWLEGKGGG